MRRIRNIAAGESTTDDNSAVPAHIPEAITRHQFRQAVLAAHGAGVYNSFYNAQGADNKLRLDEIKALPNDHALLLAFKTDRSYTDQQYHDFLRAAALYEE